MEFVTVNYINLVFLSLKGQKITVMAYCMAIFQHLPEGTE